MKDLTATLRLQFHRGFTLDDATALVDYFAELGISHIYASPLLTARPGSMHGYDVIDPTRINPELGGEPALQRLVEALRAKGMGLILDIVSNHMAVGGAGNAWWLDVLEWGRRSPYAQFFDIEWNSPDPLLEGQLLVPFLGSDYGEALQRHYGNGPPAGWEQHYLTGYASAHPHEDWAETAAHLLHLTDIADSFVAAGLDAPDLPATDWDPYAEPDAARLTAAAAAVTGRPKSIAMGVPIAAERTVEMNPTARMGTNPERRSRRSMCMPMPNIRITIATWLMASTLAESLTRPSAIGPKIAPAMR